MGESKTLDYSRVRGWGHDVTYRTAIGGLVLRGSLWHPTPPFVGDWLVLAGSRGTNVLYRFTTVNLCMDPPDMAHFTAAFVAGVDAPADIPSDTCPLWSPW